MIEGKVSQVRTQLNQLEKSVQTNSETINDLETRLKDVLKDSLPKEVKEERKDQELVPLARAIKNQIELIDKQGDRISYILNRLEL